MRAGTRLLHKDLKTKCGPADGSESLRCRVSHPTARTRSGLKADRGTVTLHCLYNTSSLSGTYLYWYKQDGNNSPKFILSRVSGDQGNTADEFKERFSSTLDSSIRSAPLKIQKLQLSDSAVYYCALQPTVTGNSKTLYKNLWSKDNRILHNIH
uniref:Ig-like domain-containing protein n=1 Tax=Maylandia zebra TaxID=106582 RepID=A0A3P9B5H1_9CICH